MASTDGPSSPVWSLRCLAPAFVGGLVLVQSPFRPLRLLSLLLCFFHLHPDCSVSHTLFYSLPCSSTHTPLNSSQGWSILSTFHHHRPLLHILILCPHANNQVVVAFTVKPRTSQILFDCNNETSLGSLLNPDTKNNSPHRRQNALFNPGAHPSLDRRDDCPSRVG